MDLSKFVGLPSHGWQWDFPTSIVTAALLLLAYVLRRFSTTIKEFLDYSLAIIEYHVRRLYSAPLSAYFSLRQYCHLQLENRSQWHLSVPSQQDIRLHLSQVYITLRLGDSVDSQTRFTHHDVLRESNRLLIVGDPGSGKTSLTKRLFWDACRQGKAQPAKARLPIMIELRSILLPGDHQDSDLGQWLLSHLRTIVSRTSGPHMDRCFDACLRSQGLLLLMDGLDEVSADTYSRMRTAITSLADLLSAASPQNILCLTMRTQFHAYVRHDFLSTFGATLVVNPFSLGDIYEFLSRWPYADNEGQVHVSRIYQDLTDRPTLRDMCRNPLVLSMYVAEDQSPGRVAAPETRSEFYRKVTLELVIRRRQGQLGSRDYPSSMREQRERLLGKLAYEHLLDPNQSTNSLSWEHAVRLVESMLGCNRGDAEGYFARLSSETGLITMERERDSFRFIHLTLCEFFAAYYAVKEQSDGWDCLMQAHEQFMTDPRQQLGARLMEVIPFAAGLLNPVDRAYAHESLTGSRDVLTTGRCFLESKAYGHPSWAPFITSMGTSIRETPSSHWDGGWLQSVHLFQVLVRDAKQYLSYDPGWVDLDLGQFFQSLVNQHHGSIERLLSAVAEQDASLADTIARNCGVDFLEACPSIALQCLDQSPFRDVLLSRAEDAEHGRLWASVLAAAALRWPSVAKALSRHKKIERWSASCAFPRDLCWEATWYTGSTLLTQVLTLAHNCKELATTPELVMLRSLTPVGGVGLFKGLLRSLQAHVVLSSLVLILGVLLSTLVPGQYIYIIGAGSILLSMIWIRVYLRAMSLVLQKWRVEFDYDLRPLPGLRYVLCGPLGHTLLSAYAERVRDSAPAGSCAP